MSISTRKIVPTLLIVVMLFMWCSHLFTQMVVVHSVTSLSLETISTDITSDHSHDYDDEFVSHQTTGFEHHHISNAPDHTHDSVQLVTETAPAVYRGVSPTDSYRGTLPLAPLYRIEKPPRFVI